MNGSSGKSTIEELQAVAEDAVSSIDEAMARLFVELGPPTVLSLSDESEG